MAVFTFIEIPDDDSIEIHCNGNFVASWSLSAFQNNPKGVCLNMLAKAFEEGKAEAKKEIKKVLGL